MTAATFVAIAVKAAIARSQSQDARRASGIMSAAEERAYDLEVKTQADAVKERDRANAEAKAQYDADQLQKDEDRAIEARRYAQDQERLDIEQKRRDAELARQTNLDAETLAARQAEFNFLKQNYADRQAKIAAGLAGFNQRFGGGGGSAPVDPRVPMAEMPPDWKPGDSIFGGGPTPEGAASPSFADSSQFPAQLAEAGDVASTTPMNDVPMSTFVARRGGAAGATPVMSEAAYQPLAAARAPGPLPLSALAKKRVRATS